MDVQECQVQSGDDSIIYYPSDFIRPADDDTSGFKVTCLKCPQSFTTSNAFSIKRHYSRSHSTAFRSVRTNAPKRIKKDEGYFTSKEELIDCITRIATATNVPLRFWDNPDVRKLVKIHTCRLRVNVNSRMVRKAILLQHKTLIARISKYLHKKVFAIKYDLGSRKGKYFLALNAQLIDSGKVVIIGLGMIPMSTYHDAKYLVIEIKNCLASYRLSLAQVTTVTTDNGKNMISANGMIMKLVQDVVNAITAADPIEENIDEQVCDEELINGVEDLIPEEDFYGDEWEDIYEDGDIDLDNDADLGYFLEGIHTYSEVRVLKCAAHTVQLGVTDYIKKDKDIVKFLATVNQSAIQWRDYINKHRKKTNPPSLSNDTR